jgi:hypothetical protein
MKIFIGNVKKKKKLRQKKLKNLKITQKILKIKN